MPVARVQSVLLSVGKGMPGVDVVEVPEGTKLSKIRRFAKLVDTDLICICDPDLKVDEDSCRQVFEEAASEVRRGSDVVAFGFVKGSDNGTVLSRVIATDKWLSHRVLRRYLWDCGIGITLPGQFLVVSTGILQGLDPEVDSYLDDLYFGWVAHSNGVRVCRVPIVVGEEDPRATWGSLLSQRVRWMRGLASLFGHLVSNPRAVLLLTIHYFAYHGLPILIFLTIVFVAVVSPIAGLAAFLGLATLLARLSDQSLWTTSTFITVFPILHCFASLMWWIPVSPSYLTKR